jgi:hypothetical protein
VCNSVLARTLSYYRGTEPSLVLEGKVMHPRVSRSLLILVHDAAANKREARRGFLGPFRNSM